MTSPTTHPMTVLLPSSPCRPSFRSALSLFGLLSLVAVTETAARQDPAQDINSEIDKILSWATPATPGCAVAVARNGKLVVRRAYGSADLGNNVPLTPDTVFDVGSLTKQFVAAAVLLLVEGERVSLSDDIRKFFPELPKYGHIITVDHLLTHTSGVRDWTGLQRLSSEDENALTMILRQRGLNFVPGEEWSYSNSGYVLLKELVARITKMSFSRFVHRRLFEPLGMKATTYADDLEKGHEKLAIGYEKVGDHWKEDVLVGNERGGGGALLSTVGDLITWNKVLGNAGLGAFVTKKLEEPARLNNGRELGYTRGLFLDTSRGRRLVWHTGSAGGYKSLLSRYPEPGLSIAILSNAGKRADRMRLARRIYDLMVPATSPGTSTNAPDASTKHAPAGSIDLKSNTGLFFSERTDKPLRLIVRSGGLRVVGGPTLVPIAAGRFRNSQPTLSFMSDDKFELKFLSSDQFELKSMEGQTTRYHRAQPSAPTAAGLQTFVGRYKSDELKAVLKVGIEDDHLLIRLNGSRGFKFAPVDRDAFQFSRMMVRFRRDENKKIMTIDFSNPLLRDVPFIRQSDSTGRR